MQQRLIEAPVEILAAVMGHPRGWDTILDSMAEHPELGPRSILALAAFKLDIPRPIPPLSSAGSAPIVWVAKSKSIR